MWVLHLGWDFQLKKFKPHMRNFRVTLNASMAYRVELFQSDFTCGYYV